MYKHINRLRLLCAVTRALHLTELVTHIIEDVGVVWLLHVSILYEFREIAVEIPVEVDHPHMLWARWEAKNLNIVSSRDLLCEVLKTLDDARPHIGEPREHI